MNYFFIKSKKFAQNSYFQEKVSKIMKSESLLVQFASQIPLAEQKKYLNYSLQNSDETCFILNEKYFFEPENEELLKTHSLKNICVEFDLQGRLGNWGTEALRLLHPTIRSVTAARMAHIVHHFKKTHSLTFKINLIAENISELLPVLSYSMELGISYVYLSTFQINFNQHVPVIRDVFKHLEIFSNKKSYITFIDQDFKKWNAATLNIFSGPQFISLDTSNSCTHNCTFCGLYAPSVENTPGIIELKKKKIDEDRCMRTIAELPPSVETIQFGGAGDPFTNKSIMHFILKALNKGIKVEVTTNFAYMTNAKIEELHEVARKKNFSLNFIVNLSGTTAETYIKTRPNQKVKDFQKVIQSLEYSAQLYREKGRGIALTLLFVTCKTNYHEVAEIVRLGAKLRAISVWIKPMEIHGEHTLDLIIKDKDCVLYAQKLSEALAVADELGVSLYDRPILEKVVEDYLEPQVKPEQVPEYRPSQNPEGDMSIFETKVQNGMIPKNYFSSHPCRIGNMYLRMTVEGDILPCCVMKPLGLIHEESVKEIWFSGALQTFRSKLSRIHQEKFHLHDPEWSICQQCPHLPYITNYNSHAIETQIS